MAKYNRNFGKLNENSQIEYAPVPLIVDGENVWINMAETYIAEGYYPVVKTERPVREGFYYTAFYEQDGETIVQRWEEHEASGTELFGGYELLDIITGESEVVEDENSDES